MQSTTTNFADPTRARLAKSFTDYREDTIEILNGNFSGATHLAASRMGLFALNEKEWVHIAYGFFFGVTLRDSEVFAFEACDLPHSPLRLGRVVRFVRQGDSFVRADVVAKGLDSGCHGMDFCGDQLHLVDTYNQQIVRFSHGESGREILSPLPTPPHGRWANTDPRYVHANTLLKVGSSFLLLLHNTFDYSGRSSEVAVYNESWEQVTRFQLDGRSCHGLSLMEDGNLLFCDSATGDLARTDGFRVSISSDFTRGLAVGTHEIAVGSSLRKRREDRLGSAGSVTFLDRDFRVRSILALPGGPTELRRLDGEDHGLSSFLERMPWGQKFIFH